MTEAREFGRSWQAFLDALERLVDVRGRRPNAEWLAAFRPLVEETFGALRVDDRLAEVAESWSRYADACAIPADLLRQEVDGFVAAYEAVVGQTRTAAAPPRRVWRNRDVTAKELLKVGKTILESLRDLLTLSPLMAGILRVLEEVLEHFGT